MKYSIEINGYEDVQVATRDLAIYIAIKLKESKPMDKVVVLKDGEIIREMNQNDIRQILALL